jgi:NitT/TauT family transport system substrate-binding protein
VDVVFGRHLASDQPITSRHQSDAETVFSACADSGVNPNVKLISTTFLCGALWLALITGMHGSLNLKWFAPKIAGTMAEGDKLRVGFIPVTCHLTCPVTDFINKQTDNGGILEPVRFNGFPELKEAFLSGYMPATFILAPLAMSLREQGVPLKIVYLGHRDGTAMMVHKDSKIFRIEDLKGKRIAVPNRYSNQRLLLFKALRERAMNIKELEIVEMPPPDMPAALYSKAVDAITSGEPFMAQTEMDGYGRILYLTKDVWPNFISCVLAVHEDAIKNRRADVQMLVDGIAKSGRWLDQSMEHRMDAGEFVATKYYNQNPKLLQFVLSKPPDRVKYTNLNVVRKDLEEIESLGMEAGILNGSIGFDDYADPSFVTDDSKVQPWDWAGLKDVKVTPTK